MFKIIQNVHGVTILIETSKIRCICIQNYILKLTNLHIHLILLTCVGLLMFCTKIVKYSLG